MHKARAFDSWFDADACGLSAVQVNPTIQELRRQKLIERERRVLRLLRRSELERMAE
ncbi:MAG: helix-turn-helix domain-containing protein [Bradyrhizobium sp.]|nr:helix-turn-helix domain-containing protein [Bradyrhizobium sp.]